MDNKKSLVKNSIYNTLYKLMNILFPLVISMYIARVLKAESIGMVAAAQNNVKYFTTLAALGIPTYGVKLIAQYELKSKESSKAFCELFIINGVLSIATTLAFVIMLIVVPYFSEKRLLYSIVGLAVIFNILNVDWFFQGIQEYDYIAIRSFIVKIVLLICIVLFVKNEKDLYVYAALSTIASVGNYLFNIFRLREYIVFTFKDLEFSEHLRHILVLFASCIAVEIYVLADTTMLDIMCDSTTVGYYAMSTRIIMLVRSLTVAISAVFLPQMSYLYYSGKKSDFLQLVNKGIHILGTISAPIALGLFLTADDAIIVAFGGEFTNSILSTRILSISIITVAISNFIGMQVLVTLGREKITTISTICGAIVNVVMNYFLIKAFKHNGAAIASATTELIVTAIQVMMSHKYIKIRYSPAKIVISCVVLAICVMIMKMIIPYLIMRIVACIIIGCLSYVFMMLLLKDEAAISIFGKISK